MDLNPAAYKAIRLLAGFSLAAAARSLGCTPSHLSNIEAGRRGASPSLIKKSAELYGVPISAIARMDAA